MNPRPTIATLAVAGLLSLDAHAASFDDARGRWICRPAEPHWPQILVDFEEDAYRRCDQNTCVSYEIAAFEPGRDTITISFGGDARLVIRRGALSYIETLHVGAHAVRTTGACAYRGGDDIYDPATAPEDS